MPIFNANRLRLKEPWRSYIEAQAVEMRLVDVVGVFGFLKTAIENKQACDST